MSCREIIDMIARYMETMRLVQDELRWQVLVQLLRLTPDEWRTIFGRFPGPRGDVVWEYLRYLISRGRVDVKNGKLVYGRYSIDFATVLKLVHTYYHSFGQVIKLMNDLAWCSP